jgi:hypothetical protein
MWFIQGHRIVWSLKVCPWGMEGLVGNLLACLSPGTLQGKGLFGIAILERASHFLFSIWSPWVHHYRISWGLPKWQPLNELMADLHWFHEIGSAVLIKQLASMKPWGLQSILILQISREPMPVIEIAFLYSLSLSPFYNLSMRGVSHVAKTANHITNIVFI